MQYNQSRIQKFVDKNLNQKFLDYRPHNVLSDALYTNIILRKLLGDDCFEWCDPKTYTNSFGKTQYYTSYRCDGLDKCVSRFAKIPVAMDGSINRIPEGLFPFKNIGITNIWIRVYNPERLLLDDIFAHIRIVYGGVTLQGYSEDIESHINTMAHILRVDGISYKGDYIYVPLLCPHNSFILNYIIHSASIHVIDLGGRTSDFEVYGNICDMQTFAITSKTNNMTHDFNSIFYDCDFNGDRAFSSSQNRIRICNYHPAYAVYITNISRDKVKSIRLLQRLRITDTEENEIEFKLDDIEWLGNIAIVWFNRNLTSLANVGTAFKFSRDTESFFVIENTYDKMRYVKTVGVHLQGARYYTGIRGSSGCFG